MTELEKLRAEKEYLKNEFNIYFKACSEQEGKIETLEAEKAMLLQTLNEVGYECHETSLHGVLIEKALASTTPSALLEVVKAAEDLCTPPDTTGLGYYGLSEVIDEHRNEGMKKLKAAIDAYKASGER